MVAVLSSVLGFPRVGAQRELKKLIEGFWAGKVSEADLSQQAQALRVQHWKLQRDRGIDQIPSGDFSFYDLVLDTAYQFGAIPARYQSIPTGFDQYFAMGRGLQGSIRNVEGEEVQIDVPAMEMKKWFDTNYHYIVPELSTNQEFSLNSQPSIVAHFSEAKSLGIHTKPVLLGPVSFLLLSKGADHEAAGDFELLKLLPQLVPHYRTLLAKLAQAGATWIQVDEPYLGLDLTPTVEQAYQEAYASLTQDLPGALRLLLTTYFEQVDDRMALIAQLPVHGLHVDLIRHPEQLSGVLAKLPANWVLSLGLVNGRNVWKTDLDAALQLATQAVDQVGIDRVWMATSCSLLHCPFSLEFETKLDPEIKDWLAFSSEKLTEVSILRDAINQRYEGTETDTTNPADKAKVDAVLSANRASCQARRTSERVVNPAVKERLAKVDPSMLKRNAPFAERYPVQTEKQHLPLFPTTTIGSFPQTKEVRSARRKYKSGAWSEEQYNAFLRQETEKCVRLQESIGLDVLVHGEFERNDMVEYFGEKLRGYAFTQNGWVASYGTRCVKPPIVYGDVDRPQPMTVEWSVYAQTLTEKPIKGMLTGPVTCLQWSFVRDDQPRSVTAHQLALALRDEVSDLEKANITTIQIDEPAIREGLPLRRAKWEAYLDWAVSAFLLTSSSVQKGTQIHTHMCYSDFNDIFPAIQRMDADVITIENSRSDLKLLRAFEQHGYYNASGPGLYDIHSPRVPTAEEMGERLQALLQYLPYQLVWLNPDCGLKTRNWTEVESALRNLTETARVFRQKYANGNTN
ncbi:methionine-synthesizing 5- methyltetrahydropteroyltriglutamate--homocysteine methyltransferase [Dispira parvispora]|uniref:5-methyltetrahydropteroyltriglutamate--homocysteine S-methyltransferase n=1 Tax=Dispira parvispora TaxID=1520584 RepID=A0A9W8E3Z1_9FUNG|nr:methionine-synthesizing 5- methyltetrahydropteroyltriglutamate--homocysteine methyltransferase [Dispira parvispora]